MPFEYFIVDTFTSHPFKGNPTGVCCVNNHTGSETMQSIAAEIQFPVTAFIHSIDGNEYCIRYFTPVTEIPACGHATLAASRIISNKERHTTIVFHTVNGTVLTTIVTGNRVSMQYPKYSLVAYTIDERIIEALGIHQYKNMGYCSELESLFLETDSSTLETLQPDYRQLEKLGNDIKEIVITTPSPDNRYDYLLRSFCPWIGIDEDPVTGSVQSVLAQYWSKQLGKNSLTAYQLSERGGELELRVHKNSIEISGQTVIVLEGILQ